MSSYLGKKRPSPVVIWIYANTLRSVIGWAQWPGGGISSISIRASLLRRSLLVKKQPRNYDHFKRTENASLCYSTVKCFMSTSSLELENQFCSKTFCSNMEIIFSILIINFLNFIYQFLYEWTHIHFMIFWNYISKYNFVKKTSNFFILFK